MGQHPWFALLSRFAKFTSRKKGQKSTSMQLDNSIFGVLHVVLASLPFRSCFHIHSPEEKELHIMQYDLTEEQRMLQNMARRLAREKVARGPLSGMKRLNSTGPWWSF